ncbi:MAG: transposase [Oribacterium sp.]|nr:transposase [Oribacterium sp.]MBP3806011.1 transposase [Oribacterium sp.]
MINHTTENATPDFNTEYAFGSAIKELGISALLKKANVRKEKGCSVFEVFQFLLLLVFQNCNLYHFLNSKKQDCAFSKNTYYRFLNEPRYNWKRFITMLSAKVVSYFDSLTKEDRVNVLVLDDSIVERNRSKCVELLSWVFNHVTNKTVKGFNMLTLGWSDGYSFIPVGFNMMASTDDNKIISPESNDIDKRNSGYKRRQEARLHKPQAAIQMIHDALASGIKASYILMDTWFTNEPFINEILKEGLDVIGMLKDNKQLYWYNGRLYNLKALSKLIDRRKPGDIFGSIVVRTKTNNIPVRLVFVRNRNNRSEYIILLTTDCSMRDNEVVRIYGNRWNIEVFFRASKSLLNLGDEFQGLSYDMTVSSTAIVFTRYIILEWLRRKANDQKTICELFYVCCDDIQDIELCTALKQLVSIITDGIRGGAVTITKNIKTQLINWFVSQPAFIRALFPEPVWEV